MKSIVEYITESKREIFTIDAFNVSQEEGIDDMQYAGQTYYSEKEAVKAARKLVNSFRDEEDLIIVTVYAGEYEKDNGDVVGDNYDIYTLSNKDKSSTIKIRKENGYVKGEVDEYLK